jgi:hypothetical protein
LRERGYIVAIRASLDERLLGYEVTSFVSIQLQSQAQATLQAFERSIAALPLVQQSWRISGGRRLPAQMCRAKRRGHAPAASAVLDHAGGPKHPNLPGAWCREGCAVAANGPSVRVYPGGKAAILSTDVSNHVERR